MARDVANAQQEIDFAQAAWCARSCLRAAAFVAPDQIAAPAIGRGITERAEQGAALPGVLRATAEHQGWLQRKARRSGKPAGVIFKGGAFPIASAARPQATDKMRDARQIDLDQ